MCADGRRCRYALRWATWLATAAGSFVALEAAGLRSGDPHGPLTPHLRAWLGVKPARPHRLAATGALAGAAAVVVTHLSSEWPQHHPWARS